MRLEWLSTSIISPTFSAKILVLRSLVVSLMDMTMADVSHHVNNLFFFFGGKVERQDR
jgi:hypothetical protein